MTTKKNTVSRLVALTLLAGALSGCSMLPNISLPFFGGAEKPKPAELQVNPAVLGVRQVWSARIAAVDYPMAMQVTGTTVHVAGGDGSVVAIDSASGRELWRASAGGPLAAGVGSDGTVSAVVTRTNDVVALSGGRELWRQKLPAQAYTAPFVAGGRVFILAADRSVTAFDGQNGRRLWSQQRPGEALVLRQGGVILAIGDTLVVGQGGRLVGLNPANGQVRWEAPIATARGVNDVERLVDLVGRVSRVDESVCARAFQAAVGCVDAGRGMLVWTQRASGSEGVHGDATHVFGSESDGRVVAWRRADGTRAWTNETLLFRGLSTPLLLGRSVVVGDAFGFVHFLSRENGSLLNRVSTDTTAVIAAPVVAGNTLVVATAGGGLYGFVPK